MLKAELLTLVRMTDPVPVYQTDVLAAKFGHSCLCLLAELSKVNHIEMVLAQ